MSPRSKPLRVGAARITGGFWKERIDTIASVTLDRQWLALNDAIPGATPSHSLMNFRIAAGAAKGEYQGTMWQDSDVAKWLEAASYCILARPDPLLASRIDEAVSLVERAQAPDGYLDTWVTLKAPDKRWADLVWGHELYVAGHFIEAGVANFEATGSTRLLGIVRRLADCVVREFSPSEGGRKGMCGHPEIELALLRLHRSTGEKRYLDMAIHFIESRGKDPGFFLYKDPLGFTIPKTKAFAPDYFLAHQPLRGQAGAEGHAVRAVYLYAAMAEQCLATGDEELFGVLRRFWESAVGRRMYLTGSIGSQAQGERFTIDWDLPPDTAYGETCASIGLAFWAARMTELSAEARYADVLERVAFNGILSGLSAEGSRYFYVNPLELEPEAAAFRMDLEHVEAARVEWFGCSCCPPNIARFVGNFASQLYGLGEGRVFVHHYATSEVELELEGASLRLEQETAYPADGRVSLRIAELQSSPRGAGNFALALRKPGWCRSFTVAVRGRRLELGPVALEGCYALEGGYIVIEGKWQRGDLIDVDFDMPARVVRADSRIGELAGRAALQRGPVVYCAEEFDNGPALAELVLEADKPLALAPDSSSAPGGLPLIEARGMREMIRPADQRDVPYYDEIEPSMEPVLVRAIPYYFWGNRRPGNGMRVWLRAQGGGGKV